MFKYVFLAILATISVFVFYFDIALSNDVIGKLFVTGILGCLVVFLLFKFGLHYKIHALNNFGNAFYYSVFEYKKAQVKASNMTYMASVREQAEVALAANFDPTLAATDLIKIPTTLYSGKDPFLDKLRAKIRQAEKIKLKARHLDRRANVLLGKTKEIMVEKDLVKKPPGRLLDRVFDIENGVAALIDLTVGEVRDQGYGRAPDYGIITRIALDNNPYFSKTFKIFDSEDIASLISRAPFMIILVGIIGTFAGFYLALNEGGDIKSGASVAIISSLVGLPVSLLMDYINTLFPDKSLYQQMFNKFKVSLEILFNHEQELDSIGKGRRKEDSQEAPQEAPQETLKEAPKETLKETLKEAPQEAPQGAPKETLKEAAKEEAPQVTT
jgi:hypothetical protein